MKCRDFLKVATAAAGVPLAAEGLLGRLKAFEDKPQLPDLSDRPREVVRGDMRDRQLGRTGEEVSLIGVGGFHIGVQKDEAESIKIIRAAIDAGVTFMDNSWDYNSGESEERMGKALRDGYRQKVFLMTKIDGRTKEAAAQQIDESLQRLQTDVIDLMQHHEIIRMEDPDRIFADGGAMEALLEAKKAGKIRYIGFTGHKDPLVHLRMLEVAAKHHFHFDAVQMPLNMMDAQFRSFADKVVPVAAQGGDRHPRHEVDGERNNPQKHGRHARGMPPLRDDAADFGGHHRHRPHGRPQPGPGGRPDVQTAHRGTGHGPDEKDLGGRGRRQIRAVQDDQPIRQHGPSSRVFGMTRRPFGHASCFSPGGVLTY